jgi:hypothetical protein
MVQKLTNTKNFVRAGFVETLWDRSMPFRLNLPLPTNTKNFVRAGFVETLWDRSMPFRLNLPLPTIKI